MRQSTFNAFGHATRDVNAHTPVWLGNVAPLPVGGTLAKAYARRGFLLAAGSPVQIKDRVITPALVYTVKAYSSGTLTIDPSEHPGFTPAKDMYVKNAGDTFTAANGAQVTAAAANASDPSLVDLTVTVSGALTGKSVIVSVEPNVVPNAYLYNDIHIADIDTDDTGASGAVVVSHAEGVLIDRTPSAGVAAAMKAAVPGVTQVNG